MTQVLISGMRIDAKAGKVSDLTSKLGVDASGTDKLTGECSACGKWAGAIARRLERSNVFCRTEFYREWRRRMWERNVYDAVFNVLGAVRPNQPTTLGEVANFYGEEVSDLVWEMSQLLRGWRALTLTFGFEERIFGIAEAGDNGIPCGMGNPAMFPFIFGNSVFFESKQYVEYLQYAQSECGLLQGIELPQRADEDYTSKMRPGNLRADGVV